MFHAFLPSSKLEHKNGCWHSFNSVKYMVLLSNTRFHLHTSLQDRTCSSDHTSAETTQTKFRNSALQYILAVLFYNSWRFFFCPIFTNLQGNHIYF